MSIPMQANCLFQRFWATYLFERWCWAKTWTRTSQLFLNLPTIHAFAGEFFGEKLVKSLVLLLVMLPLLLLKMDLAVFRTLQVMLLMTHPAATF